MTLKSCFQDKNHRIYPALKFAIFTFLFEIALSVYLFFMVTTKSRFTGFISLENISVAFTIMGFYARVFLVHLLLGYVLLWVENVCRVVWRKTLYVLLFVYAYVFISIKYPQIYDEFSLITSLIKNLQLYNHVWVVNLIAFMIIALLIGSFVKTRPFQIKPVVSFGATLAVVLFYFFGVQTFEVGINKPSTRVAVTPSKPHIFLVTVDSLRGDHPIENYPDVGDELSEYFKSSVKFNRVVSPLPQTHGALISLLTSKNPTSTHVRTNLSYQGLQSNEYMKDSALADLAKAGYEIKILRDNAEYASIGTGEVASTIHSPDYSIANVIVSTFFKNRIFFGLFNNSVGHFFLPETNQNAAFIYSYDVPRFTNTVMSELDKISQQTTPQFVLIHTCALHWPGVFPYPYYPRDSFPENSNTPFAYTSKFHGLTQMVKTRSQWQAQSQFNHAIYSAGVKLTVNEFLNPIFSQIKANGLDKNSIVVLLSDHGEDIWNPRAKLPKSKPVQHGTSLIFDASSEMSYLRIKAPDLPSQNVETTVGLVDILPSVMSLAGVPANSYDGRNIFADRTHPKGSEYYYSETGLWPFAAFNGQFISTPATDLGPLFRLEKSQGKIFVDPAKVPGIVQQKQRAVYKDDFRFTVFPTNYGYQEFLCDQKKDPDCETNQIAVNPELSFQLRAKIKEQLEIDRKAGVYKSGPCSKYQTEGSSQNLTEIAKFQWSYYYQALECLNDFHAYGYAGKIFDELYFSSQSSIYLRNQIKKLMLRMCSFTNIYTQDNLPRVLKTHMDSIPADGLVPAEKIEYPLPTARCLMAINDMKRFKALSPLLTTKSLNEYSTTMGRTSASDEIQNVLQVEAIIEKNKSNYQALDSALFDYFKTESNYNMIEELELYLISAIQAIHFSEKNEKIIFLLQKIAQPNKLGLTAFNTILWELDQLLGTEVSQMRFQQKGRAIGSEAPANLKIKEVQSIVQSGMAVLCQQPGRYCQQAKALINGDLK